MLRCSHACAPQPSIGAPSLPAHHWALSAIETAVCSLFFVGPAAAGKCKPFFICSFFIACVGACLARILRACAVGLVRAWKPESCVRMCVCACVRGWCVRPIRMRRAVSVRVCMIACMGYVRTQVRKGGRAGGGREDKKEWPR